MNQSREYSQFSKRLGIGLLLVSLLASGCAGLSLTGDDCPDLSAVGAAEDPTICADQIPTDANISLEVSPVRADADHRSVNITIQNTGGEIKYHSGDGWVLYERNNGWLPVAGGGANATAYAIEPGEEYTFELPLRSGETSPNGWHGSRYNESTGRFLTPGEYAFVIDVLPTRSNGEADTTNYLIRFEVTAE